MLVGAGADGVMSQVLRRNLGEVVATLADRPGVVSGDVDPDRVAGIRRRYPFLADRRLDVYDRL